MPASQAGRRGFESRLPLHLFNEIADFISPVLPRLPRKPHLALRCGNRAGEPLALLQLILKLRNRLQAAFVIGSGVRVDRHTDCVTALVRGYLWIDSMIMA